MQIIAISNDKLWIDTLCISLDMLFESEVQYFLQVSEAAELALSYASKGAILLVDAGMPGVDYWELADWLGSNFCGRTIILTSPSSYDIYGARMIRQGCFAVVCKSKGFSECWRAMQSAIQGDSSFTQAGTSPFGGLSMREQLFSQELLEHEVMELAELKGISQQAVNKKKLALYRKLNIKSVPTDKTFRLLTKLFDF
jgi:DNA-binding NarL/FixJ family response regulator